MNNYDVIKPAPMKLMTTHTSDDDQILAHLQGKLERTMLSDKVQEQIDLITACEKLIRRYVSRSKVVPMLQSSHNVSWATGARIYDKTQRLFGESSIKNQQFWADHVLAGCEDDIRLARAAKDWRSVSALRKLQKEIVKDLMGSGDAALYDKMVLPIPMIGFFPQRMKLDKLPSDKELKQRFLDKLQEMAEDVGNQ